MKERKRDRQKKRDFSKHIEYVNNKRAKINWVLVIIFIISAAALATCM